MVITVFNCVLSARTPCPFPVEPRVQTSRYAEQWRTSRPVRSGSNGFGGFGTHGTMCNGISFCLPLDEFTILFRITSRIGPTLHKLVELSDGKDFANHNPIVPTLLPVCKARNKVNVASVSRNSRASLALWFFGVREGVVAIAVKVGLAGVNG